MACSSFQPTPPGNDGRREGRGEEEGKEPPRAQRTPSGEGGKEEVETAKRPREPRKRGNRKEGKRTEGKRTGPPRAPRTPRKRQESRAGSGGRRRIAAPGHQALEAGYRRSNLGVPGSTIVLDSGCFFYSRLGCSVASPSRGPRWRSGSERRRASVPSRRPRRRRICPTGWPSSWRPTEPTSSWRRSTDRRWFAVGRPDISHSDKPIPGAAQAQYPDHMLACARKGTMHRPGPEYEKKTRNTHRPERSRRRPAAFSLSRHVSDKRRHDVRN